MIKKRTLNKTTQATIPWWNFFVNISIILSISSPSNPLRRPFCLELGIGKAVDLALGRSCISWSTLTCFVIYGSANILGNINILIHYVGAANINWLFVLELKCVLYFYICFVDHCLNQHTNTDTFRQIHGHCNL